MRRPTVGDVLDYHMYVKSMCDRLSKYGINVPTCLEFVRCTTDNEGVCTLQAYDPVDNMHYKYVLDEDTPSVTVEVY